MNKKLLVIGVVLFLGTAGLYIKKTIDLAKRLRFKLIGYKVVKLGLKSTTIEGLLEIKNEDKLEVTLKSLNLDVYANNIFISKIKQKQNAVIVPNKTVNVSLRADLNPTEILSNLGSIVVGSAALDDVELSFKGRITVLLKGIPVVVPFDVSSTVGQIRSNRKETTQ